MDEIFYNSFEPIEDFFKKKVGAFLFSFIKSFQETEKRALAQAKKVANEAAVAGMTSTEESTADEDEITSCSSQQTTTTDSSNE